MAELSNGQRAGIIAKLGRLVAFGCFLAMPAIGYAQSGPPGPPPDEGSGDVAKVHVACAADADRFCKDAKAGHGHVRECLKAHGADLSEGCKAALQDAREHRHPHG
jgi:Cysteine rich repeat